MRLPRSTRLIQLLAFASFSCNALAADVLSSSGFTNCKDDAEIRVNNADVEFDRATKEVKFSVSGTSKKEQKVKASLLVTAYGKEVFTKDFNPCDDATKVDKLCPVPADNFSASGKLPIPDQFVGQIPSIAFTIPDVEADATLKLVSADSDEELGCIKSGVTNGRSINLPAVSYIAVGIAGAALLLTGLSALGSAGTSGSHGPSVGFSTVFGWFQSMAMNGMHSVNYPPVYRSFSKNFAFSGGLISWDSMQISIDNFRKNTGGNLTEDSVPYLRNATLAFNDGSSNTTSFQKRDLSWLQSELFKRQISVGAGDNATNTTESENSVTHITHGIAGYVEQLTIPQANTFMTVLLIFAIVIAAITVGILLFKVILETWALFGTFPKRLTSFRQRYWMTLAKTITNLILLLYGVWTLYCIYQFTNGDSWAAKLLAGITLATFTAILGFFTYKIWSVARKMKKAEGDVSALYENKETWIKYSIFYDSYKRGYWWLFMPVIVYMFAKGCVLAAGNGHGLTQTSGQLIIESLMFIFLLWSRPYATKAGNWINIVIQVVRVLSVICILVFVERLGIAQTTKTITGVVLIGVQAGLTGILAILIAINAIIICCKENPHRKKRKEAEKLNREFDNLTPLDARNSLLIGSIDQKGSDAGYAMGPYKSGGVYAPVPNPGLYHGRHDSSDALVPSAAGIARGHAHSRSSSREHEPFDAISLAQRQPTLPSLGGSQRGFNERQTAWRRVYTYHGTYPVDPSVSNGCDYASRCVGLGVLRESLGTPLLGWSVRGPGLDWHPFSAASSSMFAWARLTPENPRVPTPTLTRSTKTRDGGQKSLLSPCPSDRNSRRAKQGSFSGGPQLELSRSIQSADCAEAALEGRKSGWRGFAPLPHLMPQLHFRPVKTRHGKRSIGLDVAISALFPASQVLAQSSSPKRGLVYVSGNPEDDSIWHSGDSDLTWYYNYQSTPTAALADSDLQFVPQQWGAPESESDTSFLDSVNRQLDDGANITHVLAFNEPDGQSDTGGSGVPYELAARTWIREIEPLKERGVKLGAPAVTGAPTGFEWLTGFFQACDGGCSPDFIPIHWYGNFEGLASHIGQVRSTYPNLTMWVTEFGEPNASLEASQTFYNWSTDYLDSLDYVERYSYFGAFRSDVSNVGPNAAMLNQNGQLTDIGAWYLGRSATGVVPGSAPSSGSFSKWALLLIPMAIWHLV